MKNKKNQIIKSLSIFAIIFIVAITGVSFTNSQKTQAFTYNGCTFKNRVIHSQIGYSNGKALYNSSAEGTFYGNVYGGYLYVNGVYRGSNTTPSLTKGYCYGYYKGFSIYAKLENNKVVAFNSAGYITPTQKAGIIRLMEVHMYNARWNN